MSLFGRLGSMILDYIIMLLIISVLAIPLLLINFFLQRYFAFDISWIILFLGIIILLNKDFFRAKSPAKRIIGFQVVNQKTNSQASHFSCFIRNLTIVIWPIEVIFTLFSKHRRIGDFIAGTRVITSDIEPLSSLSSEFKTFYNNK